MLYYANKKEIVNNNNNNNNKNNIQNPGLFTTRGIFKSLLTMTDDKAYSEPWHSQNNLFKHFQG